MLNDRPIPLPMSRRLENAWRAVSKMADYLYLPNAVKDRAVARFLRHQRPDFFDMDFAGDCLLWQVGMPRRSKRTDQPPADNSTGLRMSGQLLAAVTELIAKTSTIAAADDPVWEAILVLRVSNEAVFDRTHAGDTLAYFLAGLDQMVSDAENSEAP